MSSRWESGNLDLNVSVTHHLPAYETLSRSEPSFSLSNMGDVTSQDGCED